MSTHVFCINVKIYKKIYIENGCQNIKEKHLWYIVIIIFSFYILNFEKELNKNIEVEWIVVKLQKKSN